MPNIEINKKDFEELAGKKFDKETLLDDASFLGAHWHSIDGDRCEVETYPNRPDLLSVEGLARAYRGFFGIDSGPEFYQVDEGDIAVEVDESVEKVRPYIGGAVVRGLELDERVINGLIQMQEKMHESMGRRRDKLAIGLHDLSQVEPPFTYKALKPEKVAFTPLEHDKNMQLGEILEEHEKGQKFSWILEDEEKYPIIKDAEDEVLSFPPIINNQLTEVDSGTTDVFIDVTGKHKETVTKALNIVVTAFADRGGKIESVTVDGEEMPRLEQEEMDLDPEYFRDVTGLELNQSEMMDNLEKMKYGVEGGGKRINVEVPSYRTDVMHQYDLIEDIVIAHRYSKIEPEMPNIDRIGREQPIEDLSSIVRDVMTGAGALEALTYIHQNEEGLTSKMEREEGEFVEVENPLSKEYSALRDMLMPSMLEVLNQNKHHGYPQKFFEAADVVELDDSNVGASSKRKMAYVESGRDVDFTDARETLQALERDLGVFFELEETDLDFCVPERAGEIRMDGEKIGFIVEISQQVRENWDLDRRVSGFELDLEKLNEFR